MSCADGGGEGTRERPGALQCVRVRRLAREPRQVSRHASMPAVHQARSKRKGASMPRLCDRSSRARARCPFAERRRAVSCCCVPPPASCSLEGRHFECLARGVEGRSVVQGEREERERWGQTCAEQRTLSKRSCTCRLEGAIEGLGCDGPPQRCCARFERGAKRAERESKTLAPVGRERGRI